jgi:hypothetical protein
VAMFWFVPASTNFCCIARSIEKTERLGRMEISIIARQALLYGHILAFALALATILKEDVRLLRAKRIDPAALRASAGLVTWLLLALWATGVPMIMMDIGTDVSLLLGNPKLLAKLMVVGVLTINGFLLHLVAFPMVTGKPRNLNRAATIAAILGAVSTTSWLYASFVGGSRHVAQYLSLYDFVALYLLMLAVAIPFAILVVRNRLKLALRESYHLTRQPAGQRPAQQFPPPQESPTIAARKRASAPVALSGNAAREGGGRLPPHLVRR